MITVCIGFSLVVDRVRWRYLGISQNTPIAFFTWCVDISFSQTEENYSSNYICHEQYFNVSFSASLFIPCCTSSMCCRKKKQNCCCNIHQHQPSTMSFSIWDWNLSWIQNFIEKQTKTRNRHDLLRLQLYFIFFSCSPVQ